MASVSSPWEAINLSGTMTEVLRRITAEVERRKLESALSEAAGNVQRAAEVLQISYKTIVHKLKEYGLA
jgi:DNA-binding NtrC family response regulator